MKKSILLAILISISITLLAQNSYNSAKDFLMSKGYSIVKEGSDILSQNKIISFYEKLAAKAQYVLVAFSEDENVKELSFTAFDDGYWNILTSNSKCNCLHIYSTCGGEFRLVIKNKLSLTPKVKSTIKYFLAIKA